MTEISQKLVATILMKRLWEEKPIKVVATELNISEGRARRYFHRGLFQLQKNAQTCQQSPENRITF
jgi:hypothetical protein